MFNTVRHWQYGMHNIVPNTIIYDVHPSVISNVNDLIALTDVLTVADILIFKIEGTTVSCFIKVPFSFSFGSTDIIPDRVRWSYWVDLDNLCVGISMSAFSNSRTIPEIDFKGILAVTNTGIINQSWIRRVLLKNITSVVNTGFFSNLTRQEIYYIPNCTIMGSSPSSNTVFGGIRQSLYAGIIYANPALQTNNGGGLDADLVFAQSLGFTTVFVTNFTNPNPIIDLTVVAVYEDSIKLFWTAPIGSTNAIDHYIIVVNGKRNNSVQTPGGYAISLQNNSVVSIEVQTVDSFYNITTSNKVLRIVNGTSLGYPAVLDDGNTWGYYNSEDLSTITKDGINNVSSWRDKLGSGHDFVQATASKQPKWVLNDGVKFDGISHILKTAMLALGTNIVRPFSTYFGVKSNTSIVGQRYIEANDDFAFSWFQRNTNANNISYYSQALYSAEFLITQGVYIAVQSHTFDEGTGIGSSIDADQEHPGIYGSTINIPDPRGFVIGGSINETFMSNENIKQLLIRKNKDTPEVRQYLNKYIISKI